MPSVTGTWSSGMILASGARGREFDSPSAPLTIFKRTLCTINFYMKNGIFFLHEKGDFSFTWKMGF